MTSDTLREAATLIRERAEKACTGDGETVDRRRHRTRPRLRDGLPRGGDGTSADDELRGEVERGLQGEIERWKQNWEDLMASRAAVERVRELHRPVDVMGLLTGCAQGCFADDERSRWPCLTIRVLDDPDGADMTSPADLFAAHNAALERAAAERDRDPFAAARAMTLAEARGLLGSRRISLAEYRAIRREVREW